MATIAFVVALCPLANNRLGLSGTALVFYLRVNKGIHWQHLTTPRSDVNNYNGPFRVYQGRVAQSRATEDLNGP